MPKNKKVTSSNVASQAAEILRDPTSSAIARKLAGSALAQSGTGKQTGADLEEIASRVLSSDKYSDKTKQLAGSVLSQSNKTR
ncbi:hypothetical protein [Roseibium sp. Sym1]|uniref:hypothetical protein n=1 Tax=Roseibium sp. Sym1 TaxID=3016006 RepID=UPI0022B3C9EA|nr:hypothetical protein [Roseibium sp. Sym1]